MLERDLTIFVESLMALLATESASAPTLAIQGPMGVGKRASLRLLAGQLGLVYHETDVGGLDGLRLAGRLVALPDVQNLSPGDASALASCLATRRRATVDDFADPIRDAGVLAVTIADDADSALLDSNSAGLVSAYFPHPAQLYWPSPTQLHEMLMRWSGERALRIDDLDGLRLFTLSCPAGGLVTLERWLSLAAVNGTVTVQEIARVISNEIAEQLTSVQYRGEAASGDTIVDWLSQFPPDLWPACHRICLGIRDRFYVAGSLRRHMIQALASQAQVEPREPVILCRWQDPGSGSDVFATWFRRIAGIEIAHDIDLRRGPDEWLHEVPANTRMRFLVVDDFVGTGSQMCPLVENEGSVVRLLLDTFSDAECWILVGGAFQQGLIRLARAAEKVHRTRIACGLTWGDADSCLSYQSRILRDGDERRRLRAFCESLTVNHDVPYRLRFGFGSLGAAVVLEHNVPDDSLPILWWSGGGWAPLFARG